jgi:hypothetical protein
MHHPPTQGQKLPAFFHGLTSYKNSDQPSAISKSFDKYSVCQKFLPIAGF